MQTTVATKPETGTPTPLPNWHAKEGLINHILHRRDAETRSKIKAYQYTYTLRLRASTVQIHLFRASLTVSGRETRKTGFRLGVLDNWLFQDK